MLIQIKKQHHTLLLVILVLSAYVHLWNPVGFPDIFFDEGIYMRRAINVLETGNPQEGYFYDHPYFGQLILAGILKIAGFPDVVQHDLELSYLIPRVVMGLLAVLDTFLVYKITSKKFTKSTAILAAAIFGLLPMTWFLRRILLDTILLPFLLSSILLALYSKDGKNQNLLLVASASLLGMAIFTKITAVTMIPIVAYLMYDALKSKEKFGVLIIPVFAIPGIWPAWATINNHLEFWIRDVFWQAGRGSWDLPVSVGYLLEMDPIFTSFGFAGVAYAAYRRKIFIILWIGPFLLFVSFVGFLQYFHFIMIMPVMAVAAAYIIQSMIYRTRTNKIPFYATATAIVIVGLVFSSALIHLDITESQFAAIQYANENLKQDTTLLAGPVYTWILDGVYGHQNVLPDYSLILFEDPPTRKHMMIADPHFVLDTSRGERLEQINEYEEQIIFSNLLTKWNAEEFPYQSLKFTSEGTIISIKTNYQN